jgi:uncharacterized protein (TIGR02118 family)
MAQLEDRRTFVAGAAAAGVAALLSTGASRPARAAETEVGQECMTIVYENGEGVTFDFDYYANTQMPLIMSRYGSSISRFELRRGQRMADGSPPKYIATVSIWIADPAAFDAAAAQYQAQISANVPKFTNARPIAQRDGIVAVSG